MLFLTVDGKIVHANDVGHIANGKDLVAHFGNKFYPPATA